MEKHSYTKCTRCGDLDTCLRFSLTIGDDWEFAAFLCSGCYQHEGESGREYMENGAELETAYLDWLYGRDLEPKSESKPQEKSEE